MQLFRINNWIIVVRDFPTDDFESLITVYYPGNHAKDGSLVAKGMWDCKKNAFDWCEENNVP